MESHVPLSIEQDHPSARIRASGLPSPNARRLALQLPFLQVSESMGNHDSKIVDAASVD